mgnify:FL=1
MIYIQKNGNVKDKNMKVLGTIKELIPKLMEFDMNKIYSCEIKEPKSQRSLQQNKLLWELIHY